MNKCRMLCGAAFAVAACWTGNRALAADSEPIVVGDRMTTAISAEDGATLATPIIQSADAHVYKVGAGTLTLDQDAVSGAPVRIEVLAGKVALSQSGVVPASPSAPQVITDKAALWLDVTTLSSLKRTDGSVATTPGECPAAQSILEWCDRRDAGTGAHAYPYVVAKAANGTTLEKAGHPEFFTTNSVAGLFFGKLGSGRYMDLYGANGAQASFDHSVAHVFFVYSLYNSWGYMFGTRSGDAYWYNSGNKTLEKMTSIHSLSPEVLRDSYGSSTFVNGRWIEPYATPSPARTSLLRQDFIEQRSTMNALFATKALGDGIGNCGGDFLHEVIVFTNVLSPEELAEVDNYLMSKWSLAKPGRIIGQNHQEVALEPGAELVADVANETRPISVSGSGALVKKGAGTLSVGHSGGNEFRGTVDLQAGALLSRGGRLPPVQADGGAGYSVAAYTKTDTSAARDDNGLKMTKTTAASASSFEKTGSGTLRVNAIASNVRRMEVKAGRLVLESPLKAKGVQSVPSDLTVAVTNWNFEMDCEFGWQKNIMSVANKVVNGWWSAGANAYFTEKDSYVNWGAPEGTHLLRLNAGGNAFTKIAIPTPGWYELSFCHSTRAWVGGDASKSYRNLVDICLDAESSGHAYGQYTRIATFLAGATPFPRTYYRVKIDAAGTYRFGFRCRTTPSVDNYTYIDAIRINYLANAEREDVWPLPNGDFEQVPDGAKLPDGFAYQTTAGGRIAAGWDFTQDGASGTVIGIARWESFGNTAGHKNPYVCGDPRIVGMAQLHLKGDLGVAQTTFTPPKGRWRLQARLARTTASNAVTGEGGLAATVTIGGSETALGTVTNLLHVFCTRRWPTVFEVDGETPVTVSVHGNATTGYLAVDDFALVRESAAGVAGDELIREGDFERGASGAWTTYVENNTKAAGKYHGSALLSYPSSVYAPTAGEGHFGLRLQQSGGAYQTVTIPEAGTYRLSFLVAPRPGTDFGWNAVRAWIEENGVKREIGRAIIATDSWQEEAFTFDVAAAGAYKVGLNGLGYLNCSAVKTHGDQSECDHTSCVDAISLKRVCEDLAETPAIDDETRPALKLAAGTRLVLDYPGTMKVSSLTLDGVRVPNGVISAADYPEFLSGRGKLELAPNRGLVIVVK